jgi:hypothetical protein
VLPIPGLSFGTAFVWYLLSLTGNQKTLDMELIALSIIGGVAALSVFAIVFAHKRGTLK